MNYTENELRALLLDACRRLVERRLVERTWGNISVRLSEEEMLITPSGLSYDSLKPEDLVKVRLDDLSYEKGQKKPSSEKGVHAAVYRLRPSVNFVVHTHQFYASVVGAAGKNLPSAPCAAYGLPGTKKLVRNVEKALARYPQADSFLLARHGALLLGADAGSAFAAATRLEEECRRLYEEKVSLPELSPSSLSTLGLSADYPFVRRCTALEVMACCSRRRTLPAYLDDFAQLIGPSVQLVWADPGTARMALKNRNAVLLRNEGALCVANEADDLDAVVLLLQKNCAVALYAPKARPLGVFDARLQRFVYRTKYARRKHS